MSRAIRRGDELPHSVDVVGGVEVVGQRGGLDERLPSSCAADADSGVFHFDPVGNIPEFSESILR